MAAKKKIAKTKQFVREKVPKFEAMKARNKAERERIENAKGKYAGAGEGSDAQRIAIILAIKEGKAKKKREGASKERIQRATAKKAYTKFSAGKRARAAIKSHAAKKKGK